MILLINKFWNKVVRFEKYKEYYMKKCQRYEDELEEADKALKGLLRAANEAVELLEEADLFSDEATEHDVIAYREMGEFDNKDAYDLCICVKKAKERLESEIRCVNGGCE